MSTQVFEDENGDGVPDMNIFDDKDGDGIPDWMDFEMPDWTNIDWDQFSFQDFDWKNIDWTPERWDNFLQGLKDGDVAESQPLEFCPILEAAVGIGQSFGLAGDCSCESEVGNGLSIECGFEECLEPSVVCGSIGLNVTIDDDSGFVRTSVCVDTALGKYEEICFDYQLEAPYEMANIFDLEHTCEASYGGNPCKCEIEDYCLAVDCSAYLPGAKMDTCQYLSFDQAEDAKSLIPNFPIFNDTFDGVFEFESINWTNFDWDNLDWDNFGFDRVNWTNIDWEETFWGSLFPEDMPVVEVCPVLSSRVLRMSEDILERGCSCAGEQESGYNILCSFENQCAAPNDNGAIAISEVDPSNEAIMCGSVALDLGFGNVGSISGSLCVDFDEEIHPITCIDYSIPIADQESTPTCEATYGGQLCSCTIDEALCVQVDCSDFEKTAVMDTCQVLSLEGLQDLEKLIPEFGIPMPIVDEEEETAVSEKVEETYGADGSPSDAPRVGEEPLEDSIASANELESSESSCATRAIFGIVAVFASLAIVL